MLFDTHLITNTRYRKYRKIRGISFLLLITIGTPAYFMLGSAESGSLIEDMRQYPLILNYFCIVAVLGIIYAIIHYTTWRIKTIGQLSIHTDSITLDLDKKKTVIPFQKIRLLKIERGTTYHKKEDNFGKLYRGDNWIEITDRDRLSSKYEFTINSPEHNEEFEEMLPQIRAVLKEKFIYTSI